MDEVVCEKLAQAYAFLGNSLLRPVTQTADVGLDPAFWEAFPTFGDEGVAHAVRACAEFAHEARAREAAGGGDAALAAARGAHAPVRGGRPPRRRPRGRPSTAPRT